jgi:hypothetical protein
MRTKMCRIRQAAKASGLHPDTPGFESLIRYQHFFASLAQLAKSIRLISERFLVRAQELAPIYFTDRRTDSPS